MGANDKILHLQRLLAARFPRTPGATCSRLTTGLFSLDQAAGGGLPQAAVTEVINSAKSAGSASLVHALLHAAHRNNYFLALIDGRDSFDPCGLRDSVLSQLLWVRCAKALEAVKAADLLLRDGNFPLVIVDLVLNPAEELRKIPQTTWYRLQRLAESAPAACLVLTRQEMVSSAQLKLVLENSWSLSTLEDEKAIGQLRFRVCRLHLRFVANSPWSAVD
jgi:hypothetical protein